MSRRYTLDWPRRAGRGQGREKARQWGAVFQRTSQREGAALLAQGAPAVGAVERVAVFAVGRAGPVPAQGGGGGGLVHEGRREHTRSRPSGRAWRTGQNSSMRPSALDVNTFWRVKPTAAPAGWMFPV